MIVYYSYDYNYHPWSYYLFSFFFLKKNKCIILFLRAYLFCLNSKNFSQKFKNSNCGPEVVEHSLFGLSHHLPTIFCHPAYLTYKQSEEEVKRNRVCLFATPWTVAHQAPRSMGFSRHEYWSGLPFPSPGDLPYAGIEPGSPAL